MAYLYVYYARNITWLNGSSIQLQPGLIMFNKRKTDSFEGRTNLEVDLLALSASL
jgi:hypothetical protein